eukprot:g2517.t1
MASAPLAVSRQGLMPQQDWLPADAEEARSGTAEALEKTWSNSTHVRKEKKDKQMGRRYRRGSLLELQDRTMNTRKDVKKQIAALKSAEMKSIAICPLVGGDTIGYSSMPMPQNFQTWEKNEDRRRDLLSQLYDVDKEDRTRQERRLALMKEIEAEEKEFHYTQLEMRGSSYFVDERTGKPVKIKSGSKLADEAAQHTTEVEPDIILWTEPETTQETEHEVGDGEDKESDDDDDMEDNIFSECSSPVKQGDKASFEDQLWQAAAARESEAAGSEAEASVEIAASEADETASVAHSVASSASTMTVRQRQRQRQRQQEQRQMQKPQPTFVPAYANGIQEGALKASDGVTIRHGNSIVRGSTRQIPG